MYAGFRGEKKFCQNTALKDLVNMKKIVLDCVDRGCGIACQSFMGLKLFKW